MKSKQTVTVPDNTAVIYTRFSSDRQNEQSIDAQVRACTEYAIRNQLNIIRTYADSAQTRTNADRAQFQQMIADGKHKMFRVIIVHKLDRITKNGKINGS